MVLVKKRFPDHYGDLESFGWGVTRADALAAFEDFIKQGIISFGDYQDAMQEGAPFLYHSLISPYLNVGLLTASINWRGRAKYRSMLPKGLSGRLSGGVIMCAASIG